MTDANTTLPSLIARLDERARSYRREPNAWTAGAARLCEESATALRDALGQNHSAWLIERHKCGEPVQYWAASKWTDITSAVRFCRKKDAEEVAGGLANKFLAEYGKYETRVAEHKWLAPPTSKQQP